MTGRDCTELCKILGWIVVGLGWDYYVKIIARNKNGRVNRQFKLGPWP